MKRAHLIEWGIIVIAIIFGFKFFESLIGLLIPLIYGYEYFSAGDILRALIIVGIYIGTCLVLVKNSYGIAGWLSGPDSPENTLAIKFNKRSLLQVILIAISAYLILSKIANIAYYLFGMFKSEVGSRGLTDMLSPTDIDTRKTNFIVVCIEIVAATLVISFSKNIADWLIRRNEAEELVFDSKPEN